MIPLKLFFHVQVMWSQLPARVLYGTKSKYLACYFAFKAEIFAFKAENLTIIYMRAGTPVIFPVLKRS